jgi:hypothetical protein
MNFEGQSGSGSQEMCDLFVKFIERTYADEPWVPLDPGPGDVSDEPPFGSLQFTVLEVLNALLDLDTNKGPLLSLISICKCSLVPHSSGRFPAS